MGTLKLRDLTKKFDKHLAVDRVNLTVADGEFVVLVGPSGCGKSTTLRMIAGLETITDGDLYLNDKRLNDLHSSQRDMAMVFQSYALYPHLTVFENIAFGLRVRKVPKKELKESVLRAAQILQLENLLDRKPGELSGGQKQRVAIGRALVRQPEVFLMDEPLSNLDAKLRNHMRTEIKELQKRLNATMVYVTHDQVEAMTLGDKIVVMKDGKVQQTGTPIELFNRPVNRFVGGFIGSPPMNFAEGELIQQDGNIRFRHQNYVISLADDAHPLKEYVGKKILIGIRAEDLQLNESSQDVRDEFRFPVINSEILGKESLVYFRFGMYQWTAKLYGQYIYSNDDRISINIPASSVHLFDYETEKRLPEEFQLNEMKESMLN